MSEDFPNAALIDGAGLRFGIVAARFNQRHVDDLLVQALDALDRAGVAAEDIETVRVPGSQEVPYAAAMLAKTYEFDCIIALGIVIAGGTSHHEIIAECTAQALQRVAIDTEIPVINGIVTVNNEAQAVERSAGPTGRGRAFGEAALQMADVKRRLVGRLDEIDAIRAAEAAQWGAGDEEPPSPEDPWKL
ncbi:MAG: 6,7-dimethyl-8-ribityllumazine synthase [Verrucomicrobiota bacterium JB022]|nr:6,7-dimethyl-8-ribityllumazine synthase [Verrucomicrobiota bacterium JB022]